MMTEGEFICNFFFLPKNLRDQLAIALENGKRAQEEVEVLKEEMSAERASVQATRVIEKQKRELAVNKQIEDFNKSQEALNKRIHSLTAAMGQLSKVKFEIMGRKLGKNNKIVTFFVLPAMKTLNFP